VFHFEKQKQQHQKIPGGNLPKNPRKKRVQETAEIVGFLGERRL